MGDSGKCYGSGCDKRAMFRTEELHRVDEEQC